MSEMGRSRFPLLFPQNHKDQRLWRAQVKRQKVGKIENKISDLSFVWPRSPTKLEWDTIASYLSIFNSCLEQVDY